MTKHAVRPLRPLIDPVLQVRTAFNDCQITITDRDAS